MANTSSRTLRLLSLLQSRRYWPGMELADRLDVSVRTVRRDVDRLRSLGYPVEADRGADGGYWLGAGASLPPLALEDDEAVALAVGLQAAVQSGSVAGIEDSSVRALTKVVQVMPESLRRRVDALREVTVPTAWGGDIAGVDPQALTVVAQACRDGEGLAFDYRSAAGEPSSRRVEPHRLVLLGRRWYLVAYDLDREDWRSFRVDRLSGPQRTQHRFDHRPVPGGDAAEFVRQGITNVPAVYRIDATVAAPAADVSQRIGRWATVTAAGRAQARVRIKADQLEWPAMALGMIGAEFTVRSPPEFVAYLRDWSERFARATGPAA